MVRRAGTSKAGPLLASERLRAAASMVPPGSRVADIGTDHGILPRLLLESGRAVHCIASDRSPVALAGIQPAATRDAAAHRLELRHGDGLSVLEADDGVDVIVLTGLGARTIVRILERARPAALCRLVLEPRSEPARLRRWLRRNGFRIVEERLVVERRRFYTLITAEPAGDESAFDHPTLAPRDVDEVGPCLVRSGDPLVRSYWERRLAEQEHLLRLARGGAGRVAARSRRDLARRVLAALAGPGASAGAFGILRTDA
jgi:tRNA (adenine22-N1)-methyltransferase